MSDRYAVIGNPIGHTKSPLIHTSFAEQTGQDIAYTAIEGPLCGFNGAVDAFRAERGKGLNVTAPFKLDAYTYATDLLERARLAGAVNAMRFDGERVVADNFDGVGLTRDIEHNLSRPMKGKRVLLLGAGGAARGAVLPFAEARPAELVIANRTAAKAEELRALVASHPHVAAAGYDALSGRGAGHFDVVVNATSASLSGELPPVDAAVFAPGCLAYELAYGKGLTPFLRLARRAGAGHLADGVGMLVEQAAEAFAWWRGVRPDTRAMIARMTVPLA